MRGDLFLRNRVFVPLGLDRLVSTEVDERSREKPEDFLEHVLKKTDGGFAGTEERLVNPPCGRDLQRAGMAPDFGIGCHRRLRMAGHVDLRHDIHMMGRREGHDFPHVFPRIIPLVGSAVASQEVPVVAARGFLAAAADRGQFWVFFDRKPPALVVCEMPVKGIQLESGHLADEALDGAHGLEPSRRIEQEPAPCEPGGILDMSTGECPCDVPARNPLGNRRRQQLQQRLNRVIRSRRPPSNHPRRKPLDMHRVGFRSERRLTRRKNDGSCEVGSLRTILNVNRQSPTGAGRENIC